MSNYQPSQALTYLRMIINGTLYNSFLQFFWQKLFRGDKDILEVSKKNFTNSLGIREYTQNDDAV